MEPLKIVRWNWETPGMDCSLEARVYPEIIYWEEVRRANFQEGEEHSRAQQSFEEFFTEGIPFGTSEVLDTASGQEFFHYMQSLALVHQAQ